MKKKRVRRKAHPFPLKALLASAGWSQYQLSKSTGISYQTINGIANGRIVPSWPTVREIAITLGIDWNDLAVGRAEPATGNGRRAS